MAKKWYVLHTYSGYENKVKSNLEQRIEAMGLENNVFGIEIPTEMVTAVSYTHLWTSCPPSGGCPAEAR